MRRLVLSEKSFASLLISFAFIIFSMLAYATEPNKTDIRPERGIALYTEYSGVAVPRGETIQMDMSLENKGKADENVDVLITSVAKGWKATLKGGRFQVSGVYLPQGKIRTLSLLLEPDKGIATGKYPFEFEAKSADGKLISTYTLSIHAQERKMGADNIQVNAAYPVLRGQSDAKFEFSLEVLNKGDIERTFNLAASGPEKWEVNFRPAYEQKQISSIRVREGQSQTVSVEVTPAQNAPSGEYPIHVRVSSGDSRAEAKLTVILTGTYRLDTGTPSGLLSLEALAGRPVTFSLFVKNSGTATNRNIIFSSFKPENWETTFKPERIESLAPGEMKQIEVMIKPAAESLVGDYSVGIMTTGEKSDKTQEMRVTVKASTAWGWIGIGLIVLVIAGLSVLFVKMGRR